MYKFQNNIKEAKEIYKKLIALDSNNLTFKYNYLTILYYIEKNYEEALKVCNDMINVEPEMENNYKNKEIILSEIAQNKNYNNSTNYIKPKELFPSPMF